MNTQTFWTLLNSFYFSNRLAEGIHVICFFLLGEQYPAAIVCAHTICFCFCLNDILHSLAFYRGTVREFLLWRSGPEREKACNYTPLANSNYVLQRNWNYINVNCQMPVLLYSQYLIWAQLYTEEQSSNTNLPIHFYLQTHMQTLFSLWSLTHL